MAVEERQNSLEERINIALIQQNMTKTELAKELGLSNAYLSDLIKGNRKGPTAQARVRTIKKRLNVY